MSRFRAVLAAVSLFSSLSAAEVNFEFDAGEGTALPARIMKTISEADEWNKKGLDALDKSDFQTAMACFDKALSVLPIYSDASNNRGVVYFRKGDIGNAREVWESIVNKDPGYAVSYYNLSLISHHEHRYEEAQRLLERAIKADKLLIEAYVRLGVIDLERGQKAKALETLGKAYKMAATHADAWSFYSYALILNGDTSEAISVLKKNIDKAEALKLLGRIEASRNNYKAAADYFSRATALGAAPDLLIELAGTQLDGKNCKGAMQTLKTYFNRPIAHTADAFILAGFAAKECGDMSASQSYFEQGSKNFPHDDIVRYNLGQVYFYQKKFDQAEKTLDGLSDTLSDPSMLYLRASLAKRKNDPATAETLIRKAIRIDDRAEFHDFLGVLLYGRGNSKAAEEEFRKAIKLNPDLMSAQLSLAVTTKSPKELGDAARALEKKLSSCPVDSCADIALRLSVLYFHQKEVDKAVSTLETVQESERDERICRRLALYYREQHEWKKAIEVLEKAVQQFVTDPQTDYDLAETCLMAGFYSKAIERFTLLLPKWQQNPWRVYYQLGYAYLEQNDLARAKECFEKSLNSKKDNVASRGLLAFVLNRRGEARQARELWEKTLNDDPSNAALWINMGLSFERDGNYEEALAHFKKAAELNGNDPQININIGNVYTATGQYTDALYAYKQAMNSPKREIAAYNIFLIHSKKRDKEQAEQSIKVLDREFPGSSNAKRAQSEMALWNGDTARAISLLETVSDKENGDWLALALIHAARGAKPKAQECLNKVPREAQWERDRAKVQATLAFLEGRYEEVLASIRESRDTSLAAQYNFALACYHLKKYAEALAVADRLVKRAGGSDRADLCRLAGNAAFGLKNWENARQWYLQLSNVEARSAIVQYNLAVASYNLGQVDDAWKYYSRARELDAKIQNFDIEKRYAAAHKSTDANQSVLASVDSLYNAAVDKQSAGNDSEAQQLYLRVVEKDPLYSQAWNNLGAIYGKRGDIEKAERAYQKAVEKKHDIPETYANLVILYIELQEFGKARQWLIKGEGHNPDDATLKNLRDKIIAAERRAKK